MREADSLGITMLTEQPGGFPAAEADPAYGEDGTVAGQGGEVFFDFRPGDPAVGGEGEELVLPRFADVEDEMSPPN